MRFFLLQFLFLLCASLALTGCGKKGVLYLPDNAAVVTSTPASAVQPTQSIQK